MKNNLYLLYSFFPAIFAQQGWKQASIQQKIQDELSLS
jgi:hypothetical protein